MEIAPETVLVVKLEAQHWNIVMAGVGKLPYEAVASLVPMIMRQLQGQPLNGIDASGFEENVYGPLRQATQD